MQRIWKLVLLLCVLTVALASPANASVSCYGAELAGNPTSSGDIFDPNAMTAAHPSLDFGTVLSVSEPVSGATVEVVVNDRGPYVGGRSLDLSCGAMNALGLPLGVYPLHWQVI